MNLTIQSKLEVVRVDKTRFNLLCRRHAVGSKMQKVESKRINMIHDANNKHERAGVAELIAAKRGLKKKKLLEMRLGIL